MLYSGFENSYFSRIFLTISFLRSVLVIREKDNKYVKYKYLGRKTGVIQ